MAVTPVTDPPDDKPWALHERRVDAHRLTLLLAEAKRMLDSGELSQPTIRHLNRALHPILTRRMQWLRQRQAERERPRPNVDHRLCDYLLTALRGSHREMSLAELHDALSRNRKASDIHVALNALLKGGWATVRHVRRFPKKRSAEVWMATEVGDFIPSPYTDGMFRDWAKAQAEARPAPPIKDARWR